MPWLSLRRGLLVGQHERITIRIEVVLRDRVGWMPCLTASMRRTLAAVVAAIMLTLVSALPVAASSNEIGRGADVRHDVHLTRTPGLSTADRNSVDLRGLTITRADQGARFVLRLHRIATHESYNQYFFIDFVPHDRDTQGIGQIKVRAHTLRSDAVYDLADSSAGCPVTAHVSHQRTTLSVLVPWRCLPPITVDVRVFAYTTPLGKQGGSKLYSTDRMRLTEPVDLSR